MESSFVGYVGNADFHDGAVLSVEEQANTVVVRVRGYSTKIFVVTFSGVRALRANKPEGMILYSLSEMTCEPPLRRFVFTNWDDEDDAFLEVEAESFVVHEV